MLLAGLFQDTVSVVDFVVVVRDGASDWSVEDRCVLSVCLLLLEVFIDVAVVEVEDEGCLVVTEVLSVVAIVANGL